MVSNRIVPAEQSKSIEKTLPERARSFKPEDDASSASGNPKDAELRCSSHAALNHSGHSLKKVMGEQVTSGQNPRNRIENSGMCSV